MQKGDEKNFKHDKHLFIVNNFIKNTLCTLFAITHTHTQIHTHTHTDTHLHTPSCMHTWFILGLTSTTRSHAATEKTAL